MKHLCECATSFSWFTWYTIVGVFASCFSACLFPVQITEADRSFCPVPYASLLMPMIVAGVKRLVVSVCLFVCTIKPKLTDWMVGWLVGSVSCCLLLQHLSITFDGASGLMKTMTNTDKNITLDVTQSLLYYMSHPKVKKDWPASDAYIFRSANSTTFPLSDGVQISVVQVNSNNRFTTTTTILWPFSPG